MLAFILSPIGKVVGGVLAAVFLVTGFYAYGHHRGAASERQAILSRSVEALRERNATDEQIQGMDAAALCRALGGLPDECASLDL